MTDARQRLQTTHAFHGPTLWARQENKAIGGPRWPPKATDLIRAEPGARRSIDQLFGAAGAAGAVFILCIWWADSLAR